jgi:hypothetical protein
VYSTYLGGLQQSIGAGINVDNINKFNDYCLSEESKKFFSSVYKFQWKVVLDWNCSANCVTLSLNMGFVSIRENSAVGAGSVVLDMLLTVRVLKYINGKMWQLEDNAKTHWLYSSGDRKSNENCTAFLSTLNHWQLTFEESSLQAESFLEAFNNTMFLPWDWHTGMNMLQSLYQVFWNEILNPRKMFLGWKKISQDVHGCYFQAVRLIWYVHTAMSTYLWRCYVLSMYDNIAEGMHNMGESDVLYSVVASYR